MKRCGLKNGQALVEYVLVFTALIAVVSSLVFVVKAIRKSVVRTEELVRSDYP